MTDASHTPLQILEGLDALPAADATELSERSEHAIMNRRLDEDLV